ncbi:MAG: TonB-dependent receptor [Bacteroidia bacterium]|nr:TonB-dependent receptor [Bacteroidia bacterium]
MFKRCALFVLLLLVNLSLIAQQTVTGVVKDASGQPMSGVTIVVQGTSVGTLTSVDGKYSLQVPAGGTALQFSFIGYTEQVVPISGRSVIDVTLAEAVTGLDEVVVVGYGTQKKKLVTGATIEVKGDQITKLSTVSPMTALQNFTPGVNITKTSGEPGAGFKVNIRGVGTIGNSQPLYIVDGVPRGDINYLSPSDIESIDVLKDAASAAIYGARASNGVVMVTTKRGKANKIEVTYDGYAGVQNVYKILPLLDGKEYLMIMNEARINSNLAPYSPADFGNLLDPVYYDKMLSGEWSGTNWLKEMQNKNAPIQSHALNVTGGNQTSVFSLGASYTSQEGIFGYPVQSKYKRFTVRLNSDHVILRKEFDVIKLGENLSFTSSSNHGIGTGNMWWNDILNCAQTIPVLPMYASDPDDPAFPYHQAIPWQTLGSNPNATMQYQRGSTESKGFNLNANAYLEIQPIKGLKYKTSFSISPSYGTWRSWTPTYYLGPVNQNTTNSVTQNSDGGLGGWIFENTLNYQFSLKAVHNFNILAGMSAERWGLGEHVGISNSNSVFSDFEHAWIDNANIPGTSSISGYPWGKGGVLSYFGRINYDYKETYLLTLVMRSDASSNFAKGHRRGTFPSVSAGWVVSNESFMSSAKSVINSLKIRGSWGQNGNQSIPGFQYISQIAYNKDTETGATRANYYFNANKIDPTTGAYPLNIPTFDLKWETSEQLDLGLDARFLNSKLTLVFDYYIKKTKDWLVDAPILASWGVDNAPYINGGKIVNKGIEIALGWSDNIGDFTYNINGNMSYNHNEVTEIKNSQGIINANNVKLWGNGPYVARAEVGYPVGYFWGYKTLGVFQTSAEVAAYKNSTGTVIMPNALPGDVIFVDTNGDGVIDDDDKVMIGDPNPDVIYGLNLRCYYKGFELSVSTYGVAGNQIARCWHDAGQGDNNYTTEILNRWHGEGTSNTIPRVTAGSSINFQYTSDLQIENGDYLRISNLTLGYDFKKLIKALPLQQLRLYFTVQNLYTFTKYSGMDPEVGTSTDDSSYGWCKGLDLGFYPSPRTVMIGASVKF